MPVKDTGWEDRFEVKSSSKIDAGKGVYAKTQIKKGEHIGFYTGKIINDSQIYRKPYNSSLYIVHVSNGHYIYGEGKGSNFVSFINHCSKPNAKLVVSTRWKTARIVAVKKINKGEEVFYDYSNDYWINLGKVPK